MHIGLYSPAWPLAEFTNGIVTYVHWLRQELLRRGHRVTVFAGRVGKAGETVGIHLVDGRAGSRVSRWIGRKVGAARAPVFEVGDLLAEHVLRVHRRDPIDVFEMEESFGWPSALISMRRFPVVVKLHGPAFLSLVEEELADPLADEKIAAEGAALAQARVVISPARHTLDDTLARYKLKPPIAAHVVNPLTLAPATTLWTAAGREPDTILFVGRFDKRKGGDRVLRGFKQILQRRPQARLVFAGPDPGLTTTEGPPIGFEDFAASLFTAEERQRVTYLGSQPIGAISAWRSRAAVTLVASRWENQAYTALEAMLQGCPLAAADNGGTLESVVHGQTGMIFGGDDAVDLAEKVVFLLDQPALAEQIGQRARQQVAALHGMARVLDQTTRIYRDAVADFANQGTSHELA